MELIAAFIAAFFGAFFAFLLVIVNDWRRERRKVKLIRSEIKMNGRIAQNKLDAIKQRHSDMRDSNKVTSAPIINFYTAHIRELAADSLSHLAIDQRIAIEALCFHMEALNELLDNANKLAKEFRNPSGLPNRSSKAKLLLTDLDDIIVNLRKFIEMCGEYAEGKFDIIITKDYKLA